MCHSGTATIERKRQHPFFNHQHVNQMYENGTEPKPAQCILVHKYQTVTCVEHDE
jgi:hypothetical protein